MAISRRHFLTAGTVAMLYARVPFKALAVEDFVTSNPRIGSPLGVNPAIAATSNLTRDSFSRCLNSEFFLADAAIKNSVRLIEVNDLSRGKEDKSKGKECFSLLFLGPKNVVLPQNTYEITHASLGTFAALVVPRGNQRRGNYYEVVFNRLH